MGELIRLPTGGDVGETDFVREGGDEGITADGKIGGYALFRGSEAGEDEEAPLGERGASFRRDALGQGARRAEDDGLGTAQQDAQALFSTGEWKPLMMQRPASRQWAAWS